MSELPTLSRRVPAWALVFVLALAAAPAGAESQQGALRAFGSFADQWMAKLEAREAQNRSQPQVERLAGRSVATYTGYADDWRVEVKPTGDAGSPFVGLLTYDEQHYTCRDETTRRCDLSGTTPVTEVFGYRGGRWSW